MAGRVGIIRTAVASCYGAASAIRREPVLWLIMSGGLLIAAIAIATTLAIGEFREQALHNSERELGNTALLLARHFEQQFEDCEIISKDLISKMKFSEIASPEEFNSRISGQDAHLLLKSKASPLSYTGDVNIFDAEGRLINSSGDGPLPVGSIADRAYFKAFKSNPDLTGVSVEPVRAIYTGKWTTVFAHRLSGPGGVFLGVLGRRVDPANFEKFFASVALGKGAAISMLHRDGTLLARHPHVDSMIGQNFKSKPLMARLLNEGVQQTRRIESPVDGKDRLGSAVGLKHWPIVIVGSTTVAEALADWQTQTRFMISAAVLGVGVITVFLFLIVRRLKRSTGNRNIAWSKRSNDWTPRSITWPTVLFSMTRRRVSSSTTSATSTCMACRRRL
jgi:hypothetical protein